MFVKRFMTPRNMLILIITMGIIYSIDKYFDKFQLEDSQDVLVPQGVKNNKKRTYEEFLALAKVDPRHEIGIPWIKLPDLDGFLPTYLKYKEKFLTPVVNQGDCASCFSISVRRDSFIIKTLQHKLKLSQIFVKLL